MVRLDPCQKRMCEEIINRPKLIINAPMGAGKTISTLTALTALILRGELTNVLIVAPKRVALSVWAQEVEKFAMPLNLRVCKRGTDAMLYLCEPLTHRIAVMSVTRIAEIPHGCWDCVVVDESTLYGNYKSQRSAEMRRIIKDVPRRVLLTGTPVHGGYEKLWHQIALVGGASLIGKNITAFRNRWMMEQGSVRGVYSRWVMNPTMIEPLMQAVKPLVYIAGIDVELPPVLHKDVILDMTRARMDEYKKFEHTSYLTFREEKGVDAQSGGLKELAAFAASARGSKLRQLATGCVYADETNDTYSVTHAVKIEALRELREGYDGGLLVAYQFKSELKELKKAFPEGKTLDGAAEIDAWNRGEISMLFTHAMSAGHGLNLQFGGHVVVWYSPTYDAEVYAQFNARLPRRGQTNTVSIIHLLMRSTIEQRVRQALISKENVARNFNEQLSCKDL